MKLELPFQKPDFESHSGKAWRQDVDAVASRMNHPNLTDLSSWIIYTPWAHPLWHSYWLVTMHLREGPGLRPPLIKLEGATHEFQLYALDPDYPIQPYLEGDPVHYLVPLNQSAQFICPDDESAIDFTDQIVQDILDQKLNPDTDGRREWYRRFGDHMRRDRPVVKRQLH